MKRKIIFIGLLLSSFGVAAQPASPPQSIIRNDSIVAGLYLPDAINGYYRATRFDWSGLIASLEYKGHSYFGQWFEKYSPKIHDAVSGPVESFSPVGYDEAKAGETFVKIGVGILRKPVEKMYQSFRLYDLVDGGKWTIKKKKNEVKFTQQLHDSTGYAYVYTKTLKLIKGKPRLILEHCLKNTGKKIIETDVFDHNFPVIDKEPTGPAMKIIFPFTVQAEGKGWGLLAKTNKNEIIFLRELDKKESVYSAGLQGFGNTAKDYDFNIQNQKTGAGVRIAGDQPLEKLVYWACSTTACPEPYIKLKILPGKKMKWAIKYEFYTFSPDSNFSTNKINNTK
jgi:hypothetical protein